jgi:hypothetical protein
VEETPGLFDNITTPEAPEEAPDGEQEEAPDGEQDD